MRRVKGLLTAAIAGYLCVLIPALSASSLRPPAARTPKPYDVPIDHLLAVALADAGFTGRIEQTFYARLQQSLGRPFDPRLANLGRLLWFDSIHSLHRDNTCGGCHSPTNAFGDSQPM